MRRPPIVFGPFHFDPARGRLFQGGVERPLPGRAAAILEVLLERPGEVVPREVLLARCWNGVAVADGSLHEAVKVLRDALGDDPRWPAWVQTRHRRGYCFVG